MKFLYLNYFLFILFCLLFKLNCLNSYHNIFIPFRTKSLRFDYENENYEDIEDNYQKLNASSFLNKWFYNGIFFNFHIGSPSHQIKTFINFDNSFFSIEKCDKMKESPSFTIAKDRFISSKTLKLKEIENKEKNYKYLGNDHFLFYDTQNYQSTLYINEQYDGLNFLYDENNKDNNNDKNLCGYIGLNIDLNENSNIIEQLKKKGIISKYVWTLDYQTLSQGSIVIGSEPHFYDINNNYFSQYKTVYINLNNKNKAWSFNFDKINLDGTNIILKDTNVELLIDHGLIIGTEEYKNIIEQIYFNKLINEGICFKEITKLENNKISSNEYIIFYCDKIKFKGDFETFSSSNGKPFNKFNTILLYQKKFEYIFKMGKEVLFEDIDDKIFFLIIFEKNNKNRIWKLGEPFISQYKFVFNHEQKTIGFYNYKLDKTLNSENDNNNNNKKLNDTYINNKDNIFQNIFNIIKNILIILVSIFVIIFIIKKILFKRKLRANELLDNYEYLSNKNVNNNIIK